MNPSCTNSGTMMDNEFFDERLLVCHRCKYIAKDVKELERHVGKSKKGIEKEMHLKAKKGKKTETKNKAKKEIICPNCCDYSTLYVREMVNHLIETHLRNSVDITYNSTVTLTQSQYFIILVYYANLISLSLDNYYEEKDYVCPVCGYLMYSGITHDYDPQHFWKSHLENLIELIDYSSDNEGDCDDFYATLIIKLVKDSRVGSDCKQLACPFCLSPQLAYPKLKKHLKDKYLIKIKKKKKNRKNRNVGANIVPEISSYDRYGVPDSGTILYDSYFSFSKTGLELFQHCSCVGKSMKILKKHVRKNHSDNLAVDNWLTRMGLRCLSHQNELSIESLGLENESLGTNDGLVASRTLMVGRHSIVKFHLCIRCNYSALSVKMLKKHVRRNHIGKAVSMPSLAEQQSKGVCSESTQFDVEPLDVVGATFQYSRENSHQIGTNSYYLPSVTDSNSLIDVEPRRYVTASMRQTYKEKDRLRPVTSKLSHLNKNLTELFDGDDNMFDSDLQNQLTDLDDVLVQCPYCTCIVETQCELEKHLKATHLTLKLYRCNLCDFEGNSYYIKAHRLAEHDVDTEQKCRDCGYHVFSKSDLRKHTLSEHRAQKRCCNQLRHLIIHSNQHIKKRKGKIFHHFNYISEFSDFNGQKMVINKKEISECTKCNVRCKNSFNLKAHMILEHTSKKPFICRSCGYKALTSSNIIKHVSANHKKKRGRPSKKTISYKRNLILASINRTKDSQAEHPYLTKKIKIYPVKKCPVLLSWYLSFL